MTGSYIQLHIRVTPTLMPPITTRLSPALAKKMNTAIKRSGVRQSELVRTALEQFLKNHDTPESMIQAIVSSRVTAQK